MFHWFQAHFALGAFLAGAALQVFDQGLRRLSRSTRRTSGRFGRRRHCWPPWILAPALPGIAGRWRLALWILIGWSIAVQAIGAFRSARAQRRGALRQRGGAMAPRQRAIPPGAVRRRDPWKCPG